MYNPPRTLQKLDQLFDKYNKGTIWMVQEAARIAVQSGSNVLILGNFNYKETDWDTLDPHGGKYTWRVMFLECAQNYLYWHVSKITKARVADVPSKLDFVFTHTLWP